MPEPAEIAAQDQRDAELVAILEQRHRCPDCGGASTFRLGPIDYATDSRQCHVSQVHEAACPNTRGQLRWEPTEENER